MTVADWLKAALADAERRKLPELKPLLEGLAQATESLRAANFAGRADGKMLSQEVQRQLS